MCLSLNRGVLPQLWGEELLPGLSLVSHPEPCLAFILFQFPDETLRSGELLNMIVAVIDSFQVRRGPVSGVGSSVFLKWQHCSPPLPGALNPTWPIHGERRAVLCLFHPPCPHE